jgi:hypothetical protein
MTEPRRRSLDLRLPIGIAVILASVAAAVALVASLDRTATAWAAPHDLVAGDVIRLADLQPRPVRLDLVESAYLVGPLDGNAELVVLRSIGVGELVPTDAVGDVSSIDSAVVVVPIGGPLASGLVPGSSADLWAAAPDGTTGFDPPVILVPTAVVGRVVEESGIVAGAAVAVEVVVPRNRVAIVLEALADGAAISLVPALPRPAGTGQGAVTGGGADSADDPLDPPDPPESAPGGAEPSAHPTPSGG